MSDLPKLLTPRELADMLTVSEETLAQNRYLGQGIPFIKVGKRVRYQLADVVTYLENQRVQTTSSK
ncbi:helix-turn-helix domain-containing protein [Mycobacterium paraintracellulare]|uniref:helix-turn-helix domain-containing protein n=1 Tax=Mycobacterium paraintracellulare TaxID=1138383 RepID=UPI0019269833|nr:helix-turn-helix domain-containing protein [Mycobacterium paraintracellulare]BCP05626.1 hypothetical protein MINTM019_30820 [Mycobacterium paraintracellulare]